MRSDRSIFTACLLMALGGLGGLGALGAGCERPGGPAQDMQEASLEDAKMPGFSWVIDGKIAGMPRPGGRRALDEDVLFLQDQGVEVVVSLTEVPVDPAALKAHGIEGLHLPVEDFHPPTQDQLDRYVTAVQGWMSEGRPVATHCGAGLGRTGTFLAALFVARGLGAEEAIAEIRKRRPGSIETDAQEEAVREFARRHAKRGVPGQ